MRGHAPLKDPKVILIAFRLQAAISRNLGIAKELDASTRKLVSLITYANAPPHDEIAPPATKIQLEKDLKKLGTEAYRAMYSVACAQEQGTHA
ncbi:hypothetical protein HYFRA_00006939 [Hymenoscyphus fraxineus]|uniref:Uncharacterized protein n=1 Tax=Hymenoscyphus fraxineus TaxID=746836 RepID=A0A9N9KPL1_9HELO|nr:hypothetical protein HYFRA_00006939 [Hymenoscyphus fraxineus]